MAWFFFYLYLMVRSSRAVYCIVCFVQAFRLWLLKVPGYLYVFYKYVSHLSLKSPFLALGRWRNRLKHRVRYFFISDLPRFVITFSVYYAAQSIYWLFQVLSYVVVSYFRLLILWITMAYNGVTFSFFYITGNFFLLFDILRLGYRLFFYPWVLWCRLLIYRFGLFLVRRRLTPVAKAFGFILRYSFVLIAGFAIFAFVFSFSDIFASLVRYDLGTQRLDFITTGLVGSWYTSNWWYARIWVFYAILYAFVPKLRLIIRENLTFIVLFPAFLFVYDHRGVTELPWESFTPEEIYGWPSLFMYGAYRYMTPGFARYKEGINSIHSGDLYVSSLDSNNLVWTEGKVSGKLGELGLSATQLPPEAVSFSDPDTMDSLARSLRRYRIVKEMAHAGRRTLDEKDARTAEVLHYVMDSGEMFFRASEFSDLVPVGEVYLDEGYYSRVVSGISDGSLSGLNFEYRARMPYDDGLLGWLYRHTHSKLVSNEVAPYDRIRS